MTVIELEETPELSVVLVAFSLGAARVRMAVVELEEIRDASAVSVALAFNFSTLLAFLAAFLRSCRSAWRLKRFFVFSSFGLGGLWGRIPAASISAWIAFQS